MSIDQRAIRRRAEERPRPRRPQFASSGVILLIIALWSWAWVPQLIDLLILGRQYPALGEASERSPIAGQAYVVIIVAIVTISACTIVAATVNGETFQTTTVLMLVLPWLSLNVTYLASGGRNNEVLAFPIAALAFAINYRHLRRAYAVLRGLVVTTAVASIALGTLWPSLFLSDSTRRLGNEKALFGNQLLNGLFPTSNQLGITLALGIPLIIVTGQKKTRWAGVAVAVVAMTWASSRTSLAATAIVLLALILTCRKTDRLGRQIVAPLAAFCGIAAVAFPFLFQAPQTFSGRVAIWRATLSYVGDGNAVAGGGATVFREVSPITLRVGAITGTGHNVFITTLAVGGLIAVAALIFLWIGYLLRALEILQVDPYPATFLLTVTALAILEDPFRAFIVAPSAFEILPLLAMPLAQGEVARRLRVRDCRSTPMSTKAPL